MFRLSPLSPLQCSQYTVTSPRRLVTFWSTTPMASIISPLLIYLCVQYRSRSRRSRAWKGRYILQNVGSSIHTRSLPRLYIFTPFHSLQFSFPPIFSFT
ncbi:hypothetical protein DM02DRAFT_9459 [Periconia macrospinosa]|uniref:Uncharacterized protein n=1 Tax=Periconia macrospinosa TaxID=97972 RepID=A0A2V1EET2_9PLEO|nr:hypothetical protein DM02DRAFT_9459 [Periconia macrospinosa]